MHALLPVIVKNYDDEEFEDNPDVEDFVETWLIDEGFVSKGFFGSGPADWFVCGTDRAHRWRHLISESHILPECVTNMFKKYAGQSIGMSMEDYEKYSKELELEIKGSDIVDDVIIEAFLGRFVTEKENMAIVIDGTQGKYLSDYLSFEKENFEDLIGDYIVLVDYHF